MKIIARYILREHLGPLVFALSALTSLLLLNFVAKKFGDLVGKGLPWTVIAEFLMLSIPFTLAMTLPMAVLVATLHAFSRFAAENEITALKASGVSMQVLVRPVILAATGLALFMVWFNDQVLPRANHRLATLQADIARVKPTLALGENVINEVVRGQLYLRAARIDPATDAMRDVTIYDLANRFQRRTIRADSGVVGFTPGGADLVMTLYDGHSTETLGSAPERLQRSFFKEDRLVVRGVATQLERDEVADPTYKSDREMTVCELHSKVAERGVARDSSWARLRAAEEREIAAGRLTEDDAMLAGRGAPKEPWGLANLYCALQAKWAGMSLVQEAEAAQQPTRRADKLPPSERRRLESPPEYESVVLQGMRYEYTSAQSGIDRYRVEIEKKFSIAVACVVFVLLGAPIALRFPRGGVGLTISVSLGVFAVYYVGLLAGEALSDRGTVDPALAMWLTNILMGIVGVVLTARLGSEGSTSRGSETSEWWGRLLDRWRDRVRKRPA